MIEENSSKILPLIPLRDIVVFPNMVAPLFVGRDKSVKALEDAMNNEKEIISKQKTVVEGYSATACFYDKCKKNGVEIVRLSRQEQKIRWLNPLAQIETRN